MSSFKPQHHAARFRSAERVARNRRQLWIGGVVGAIVVAFGLAGGLIVAGNGGSRDVPKASQASPDQHGNEALPPGYRLTGEVSPMGGKVIETPGTRAGVAAAGTVMVTDGADLSMGRIPLAFAVNPTWHLRNTGDEPVSLGQPRVTVVKGCCPTEPLLGTTTLAPGAATTLEFPLQMHPGMGGPHLFQLAVPVSGVNEALVVSVAGDFS